MARPTQISARDKKKKKGKREKRQKGKKRRRVYFFLYFARPMGRARLIHDWSMHVSDQLFHQTPPTFSFSFLFFSSFRFLFLFGLRTSFSCSTVVSGKAEREVFHRLESIIRDASRQFTLLGLHPWLVVCRHLCRFTCPTNFKPNLSPGPYILASPRLAVLRRLALGVTLKKQVNTSFQTETILDRDKWAKQVGESPALYTRRFGNQTR